MKKRFTEEQIIGTLREAERRGACYRLRQPEKDRPIGQQRVATSQRFPRFGYRRAAAWLQLGETRTRRFW